MKKTIILLSLFLLAPTVAFSVCPATTTNPPRTIKGTMKQVKNYIVEKYEELSETEEEKKKTAKSGNQDCSHSPQNTEDQAIKITVYEYLTEKVIGHDDETDQYLTPTDDFMEARREVKEKLFQPAPPKLTEKGEWVQEHLGFNAQGISQVGNTIDQVRALIRRDDYANAVASKNLEISTELRKKVLEDIASTQKAETDGCNQLQGLVLENRNLGALIAETAADITIQILTLESMAVRNLQKEQISLVPVPTIPKQLKNGTVGGAGK